MNLIISQHFFLLGKWNGSEKLYTFFGVRDPPRPFYLVLKRFVDALGSLLDYLFFFYTFGMFCRAHMSDFEVTVAGRLNIGI
jgi:hypothetical protein